MSMSNVSRLASTMWKIDPSHTLVEFSAKHMMIATVKGRFRTVDGTVTGDMNDLTTLRVEATIDPASLDTGEPQRDDHLRSADFFVVAEHPRLTFVSDKVTPVAGNAYTLTGHLTIRGIRRELVMDLTYDGQGKDPWGQERAAFSLEGKVNKKDFDMNWNTALTAGGFLIGDQIKIFVQVELIKQNS